jgi:hypothetical protein
MYLSGRVPHLLVTRSFDENNPFKEVLNDAGLCGADPLVVQLGSHFAHLTDYANRLRRHCLGRWLRCHFGYSIGHQGFLPLFRFGTL